MKWKQGRKAYYDKTEIAKQLFFKKPEGLCEFKKREALPQSAGLIFGLNIPHKSWIKFNKTISSCYWRI